MISKHGLDIQIVLFCADGVAHCGEWIAGVATGLHCNRYSLLFLNVLIWMMHCDPCAAGVATGKQCNHCGCG